MERLKAFRHLEGLTQAQLGDLLGVSAQVVSTVESGRRLSGLGTSPTGYSLARMRVLPGMTEPMHRSRASTHQSSRKRTQELLRLAGEVFTFLASKSPQVPSIRLRPVPFSADRDDLEQVSAQLRDEALRHSTEEPLENLTSLIERAGICLVPIVGMSGVDGLSSWVEDIPVIGINPQQPGDRFRFTLMHELVHLSIHKHKNPNNEREANGIASAILMPQAAIQSLLDERMTLLDFERLKTEWGVSIAALVRRAKDLAVIGDDRYRSLQIQMSRWRKQEPASFVPVPGQLFPKMMHAGGGVTKVSQIMGIKESHVASLVDWRKLGLVKVFANPQQQARTSSIQASLSKQGLSLV